MAIPRHQEKRSDRSVEFGGTKAWCGAVGGAGHRGGLRLERSEQRERRERCASGDVEYEGRHDGSPGESHVAGRPDDDFANVREVDRRERIWPGQQSIARMQKPRVVDFMM